MSAAVAVLNPMLSHSGVRLTQKEILFIIHYIKTGNAKQSIIEAGYKTQQPERYGSDLLRKENVHTELAYRLQELEDQKIADAREIKQFYTSVMRGEVLDQFGIECSVDTRIKAANELARIFIDLPMKLENKNNNTVGSVTLNFLPRKSEENEE